LDGTGAYSLNALNKNIQIFYASSTSDIRSHPCSFYEPNHASLSLPNSPVIILEIIWE
jgi:hypothetical protein